MLLVLVYLAALGPLAAAQTYFQLNATVNITRCPVSFYGRVYNTLYVDITQGKGAVCFKGHYPGTPDNDCVVTTLTAAKGSLTFVSSEKKPGSSYHIALPALTGSSFCAQHLLFYSSNNVILADVAFRTFGNQSILFSRNRLSSPLSSVAPQQDVTVTVDGDSTETFSVSSHITTDTTACRPSGVLYRVNQTGCDPDGSTQTCTPLGTLTVGPCGGSCPCPPSTCTVIGSSVISSLNSVTSVPDRCAYTLLSESGVRLLAAFRDRRRKDVSMLDRVILRLDGPGVNITLGPGGRLQVNDDVPLSLGSSPLSLHGVNFTKSQSGVTATFLLSNRTASVFFDGSTAQILLSSNGPETPARPVIPGLCFNSSGASGEASPEFSSSGCQQPFPEPADETINCTTATERCNVLREAPFASCHNHTDPEPFISACNDTLCRYPAVDGVSRCRFLEAYVEACDLQTNGSLGGWRSGVGCAPPRASCQDVVCADHEFCAQGVNGGTSCACRAIFASKYRSAGAFGEPTVCDGSSASVTLLGCLLGELGIDSSELHLNNQSCRGQMDNVTNMVTFGFDSSDACGAVVELNNSQIIYKNSIMTSNSSGIITRHDQFIIDFSCFYQQPIMKTVGFKIKHSSVITQIVSGPWNYTLTMNAFSDAGRTRAIGPTTEIPLQQRVWAELKTDGLDDKLVAVVTDSCWATNQPSANSSLRYDLVVGGCSNPADQTVQVEANGLGTSNYFSFKLFQFSGKSGDVYLHCKLNLCVKKGNTCAPSCGGKRRRRSARATSEDGSSAFITMAWTN